MREFLLGLWTGCILTIVMICINKLLFRLSKKILEKIQVYELFIDFIHEWKIRFRMYFFKRGKIIVKNKGVIQWSDKSVLHRPSWMSRYTIEEMMEFIKDLKE